MKMVLEDEGLTAFYTMSLDDLMHFEYHFVDDHILILRHQLFQPFHHSLILIPNPSHILDWDSHCRSLSLLHHRLSR